MSVLHREIMGDILRLGRDEAWAVESGVGEKPLAERLGVSRTPIRRALIALSEQGVLRRKPGQGFVLNRQIDSAVIAELDRAENLGGALYQRILTDRNRGEIPDECTESWLIARFQVARGDLRKALLRLSAEGIVHRQRGHGWRFGESLDTPAAIIESYAFREVIETAAIRQPGFRVDGTALARLKASHEALINLPADQVSPDMWFQVNASFHEKLVSWSHNRFFQQAVKRQNSLRQMHQFADFLQLTPGQIAQSCREHLAILEALSIGDLALAASLLSKHLRKAAAEWEHDI